jgi:hypothetical protein
MACVGLEGGVVDVNYQFMTQADDSYIGDAGMCVPAPSGPPASYTSYTDPNTPLFTVMAFVNNRMSLKPYMPVDYGVTGGFPMGPSLDSSDLPASLSTKLSATLDSTVTPDIAPDAANSSLRPVILVMGFAPQHQLRSTGSEIYFELSAINNHIYAHVTSVWQGISCYNTITGFVYQRGQAMDVNTKGVSYFIQTNINPVWSFPVYDLNVIDNFSVQLPSDADIGLSQQDYVARLNVLFMRIIRVKQEGTDIGKISYILNPGA